MLLFYFGNDFDKKHTKVKNILSDVKSKKPNSNFIHYDSFDIKKDNLLELIKSQGLFETKNIVLLSNIFIDLDLKKWILENLEEFEKSESAFIFSEEKITPTEAKKIKDIAYKFEEFKFSESRPENLFKISDYLLSKNKKKLWIFFNESIKKGNDAESLYNVIFWSMKTLSLAEKFSEKESGLKSFPYSKAKNNLKNWKTHEPSEKLFQLLKLHSESRRGILNLKNSLEKFLLEL